MQGKEVPIRDVSVFSFHLSLLRFSYPVHRYIPAAPLPNPPVNIRNCPNPRQKKLLEWEQYFRRQFKKRRLFPRLRRCGEGVRQNRARNITRPSQALRRSVAHPRILLPPSTEDEPSLQMSTNFRIDSRRWTNFNFCMKRETNSILNLLSSSKRIIPRMMILREGSPMPWQMKLS